jgi:hypothetical protein
MATEWNDRIGTEIELTIHGSTLPIKGRLLRVEGGVLVLAGSQPGTERKVDIDDIASYLA